MVLAVFGLMFLDPETLVGIADKNVPLLELVVYVLQKSTAEEFIFRLMAIDYFKRFKLYKLHCNTYSRVFCLGSHIITVINTIWLELYSLRQSDGL